MAPPELRALWGRGSRNADSTFQLVVVPRLVRESCSGRNARTKRVMRSRKGAFRRSERRIAETAVYASSGVARSGGWLDCRRSWGHSSAGRASGWQPEGRRFGEPGWLHRERPRSAGPLHRSVRRGTGDRIHLRDLRDAVSDLRGASARLPDLSRRAAVRRPRRPALDDDGGGSDADIATASRRRAGAPRDRHRPVIRDRPARLVEGSSGTASPC